jgi:hypothetical protein
MRHSTISVIARTATRGGGKASRKGYRKNCSPIIHGQSPPLSPGYDVIVTRRVVDTLLHQHPSEKMLDQLARQADDILRAEVILACLATRLHVRQSADGQRAKPLGGSNRAMRTHVTEPDCHQSAHAR